MLLFSRISPPARLPSPASRAPVTIRAVSASQFIHLQLNQSTPGEDGGVYSLTGVVWPFPRNGGLADGRHQKVKLRTGYNGCGELCCGMLGCDLPGGEGGRVKVRDGVTAPAVSYKEVPCLFLLCLSLLADFCRTCQLPGQLQFPLGGVRQVCRGRGSFPSSSPGGLLLSSPAWLVTCLFEESSGKKPSSWTRPGWEAGGGMRNDFHQPELVSFSLFIFFFYSMSPTRFNPLPRTSALVNYLVETPSALSSSRLLFDSRGYSMCLR